jgi:hypothetical protein
VIHEKFNQYFHSKGFKLNRYRSGAVFKEETLADDSTRLKSFQYIELDNKKILIQESPIDGLLTPDVIKSEVKDEFWSDFYDCIEPIDEREESIKKKIIRIADFYSFLVQKYEENKRGTSTINEIILESITKYGMLTIGKFITKEWAYGEYKDEKGHKSYGNYMPRMFKEFVKRDLSTGINNRKKRDEYNAWLFVFNHLIPSTLEYVSKDKYELTKEMLNYRIRNIEVEFENIKTNKLKISPNDLMSALIIYAKTKSIKKLPIVNCLYCDKPFKQKVVPGRPQKFCSPSHKNMYNLNLKKKKTKNP